MNLQFSNLEAITSLIKERLDKLEPGLKEALDVARNSIISRTQQGIDADDRPFRKYSKSWAEVRKRNSKQVAFVDLTFQGDMLKAITQSVKKDGPIIVGTLDFKNEKERQKARENQIDNRRKFFALSQAQRSELLSNLRKVK